MSMPLINFDDHFAKFTAEWIQEHTDQYPDVDSMEDDLPQMYLAFLNKRASWLGNVTTMRSSSA